MHQGSNEIWIVDTSIHAGRLESRQGAQIHTSQMVRLTCVLRIADPVSSNIVLEHA